MEKNNPGIDIELTDEVAQGTYSNLAVISHSTSEFVLDFLRLMPGMPKAQVKSRIILTPEHTKRLMLMLQENMTRYEKLVGKVNVETPQVPIINTFGSIES